MITFPDPDEEPAMKQPRRALCAFLALISGLSWTVIPATAQALPLPTPAASTEKEADSEEIQSYRLSLQTLKKIEKVYTSLDAMVAAEPGLQEKLDRLAASQEDSGPTTIAEAVAQLDSVPAIQKAIRSSALTSREFVVFTVAFGTAGLGDYAVSQGQQLPPDIPPAVAANIRWFQDNRAEIDRVQAEMEKLEAKHRPAPSPR